MSRIGCEPAWSEAVLSIVGDAAREYLLDGLQINVIKIRWGYDDVLSRIRRCSKEGDDSQTVREGPSDLINRRDPAFGKEA